MKIILVTQLKVMNLKFFFGWLGFLGGEMQMSWVRLLSLC